MKNDRSTSSNLPSMARVVRRIALLIAAIEFLIMLIINPLEGHFSSNILAALDVALLAGLSTPIIYLWVVRPFSQAHIAALQKIHHMACHDELTALPNRRQLVRIITESLAASLRHNEGTALLFIDLDSFKKINDTYGHEAGDLMLKATAERLRTHIRTEDAVSRIGGDEFVVMISRLPPNDSDAIAVVQAIAQKLAVDLCAPVMFEHQPLSVGTSIGIRVSCGTVIDAETLLREADEAMYMAKRHDRAKIWIRGTNDITPHAAEA